MSRNRTQYVCAGAVRTASLLCAAAFSALKAETQVVVLIDQAGVEPKMLAAAQGYAARVFRHAGVDLSWELCSSGRGFEIDKNARAQHPLFLELVRGEGAGISKAALGYANVTKEGGEMAVLYLKRLENLTGFLPPPASREQILGHMMAHELAHLLSVVKHSPSGIMRARWADQDFWRMAQGRMNFTATEEATLRLAVRRRAQA